MSDLSPTQRFNRISECGLCIGCGVCQSIAGESRIQMKVTELGSQRPVVLRDLDHEVVDLIYDVCPGTRVEGLPTNLHDENTVHDPVWGEYQNIVMAYASNPEVRFKASTGGVLSALALYLIAEKKVDFILHARASTKYPSFGEAHISENVDDVMQGAGSRYGPTASLIDVHSALDRNQPFAYIGKPCDIATLRNLARHDERVDRLVKYWLAPVCGGFSPPPATQRFLNSISVSWEQLKFMRYRGHGCPGPVHVETHDGRKIEKNYIDLWGEDETQWSLPFRCKVCPDGIGEAADVAASDNWPGGGPEREGQEKDPGTNAVIARTAAGARLMSEAEQSGYLTIESTIGIEEMNLYQPHQVNKKYSVWSRHKGLREAGQLAPETSRLRIAELASSMDDEFNRYQTEGTKKRVMDGKTREPTPSAPQKI